MSEISIMIKWTCSYYICFYTSMLIPLHCSFNCYSTLEHTYRFTLCAFEISITFKTIYIFLIVFRTTSILINSLIYLLTLRIIIVIITNLIITWLTFNTMVWICCIIIKTYIFILIICHWNSFIFTKIFSISRIIIVYKEVLTRLTIIFITPKWTAFTSIKVWSFRTSIIFIIHITFFVIQNLIVFTFTLRIISSSFSFSSISFKAISTFYT